MSRYVNRFDMDDVREFWDRVAEREYVHRNGAIERVHTQRFREALKRVRFRPGMRVLNIWSRIGDGIPHFRGACDGIKLVNAELSMAMLKISHGMNPGESHIQVSLHEFPFGDEAFDTVVSLETLEHVPDPLLFLKEIRRVLAAGGTLVMSLPPSAAEWTSVVNKLFKFHHGEGPHRFLSPREVKRMLADAGLKLEDHTGTLFLPVGGMLAERIDSRLGRLIGKGPLAQLGLRQFYVCTASM